MSEFRQLFVLREVEGNDGGVSWERSRLDMGDSSTCTGDLVGQARQRYILSFGEDEDGEVYMLTARSPTPTLGGGTIYRIVDPAR